jgi:hypothetical protein
MQILDPTERLGRQMARLNAANVRFDVGAGGGAPALTPQDVAAAIGMVPEGIGRELLLYVYWPDGAARRKGLLMQLLQSAQLAEHNDREQAVHGTLFQAAISTGPARIRATQAHNAAQLARWPQLVVKTEPLKFAERYELIRLAVLEELAHPRACPECQGRELRDRHGVEKTCARCMGRGVVEYGPTWRAKQLDMKRAAFLQRWESPYLWLLDLARSMLAEAETALLSKLR